MSVKQMALVWDLDLPPNKKFVLLAYADHADHDGGSVYPSLGRIAHKTGYSRRQVIRVAQELVAAGLMERVREATHETPAEYQLHLERGDKLTPLQKRGVTSAQERGDMVSPEPSLEPSGVEANASSGKPQTEKPVGLEKYIVDQIYETMRKAGKRLPNSEYPFHLGRARDMLEKDNPTDDELENLPAAFLRTWTIKSRCDAPLALVEMRRQKDRTELLSQPSEAPSYYDKQVSAHDKARSPIWYASVYEADFSVVEGWIKEGCGHEEIEQRLAEGVA